MKRKLLSFLLVVTLAGSSLSVNAAEMPKADVSAENIQGTESAENIQDTESAENVQDTESAEETAGAEETESADRVESTKETEPEKETAGAEEVTSAEETECAEETAGAQEPAGAEETESAQEPAGAEETESAQEPADAEETESAQEPADVEETESAEETVGAEETECTEETAEEVLLPENEIVGENESFITEEQYAVASGYQDFYSESDIREFLEQQESDELVGANENAEVFDSYEEIVAYLKAQMKARQVDVSFQVMSGITDGLGKQVYDAVTSKEILEDAMEENENTPADEGDYIRANYLGYSLSRSYNSKKLIVEYTFVYTSDAAQEAEVNAAIGAVMDFLDLEGKSDYEKLKAIHDYIVNHIDYVNDDTYLCHSTYAALIKGECVCQGYASLFQRMCKLAGFPTRYITGTGNGGGHAWNIVKLGDVWYNVDTTWDDPTGGNLRYTYFLKSDLDFGDHERNERYLTSDFYAQHPMAKLSYGEDLSGLDGTNKLYSFLNIDGGTLDTVASGKAKILVFFGSTTTGSSKKTLTEISQSEWVQKGAANIYAINCVEHTAEKLETYREENCPEGYIKFGYTTNTTALSALWYYADMLGIDSVSYPVIAMIDADNRVQYVTTGYVSAQKIDQIYMPELIEGWQDMIAKPLTSVKMSQSLLTLEKGEKAKLRVIYAPADTTDDTTARWSSSDSGVAAVDEEGNVTAISAGEADITAKMGRLTATCYLTVNPSVYTITFMSGGVQYTTMQFKENETVANLPTPVRSGYHFTGWYLDGNLYEEGGLLTGDITLTAGWKAYETLTSPTCSVTSGSTVTEGTEITLDSPVAGAMIYYTLDGTEPTTDSDLYRSPLAVHSDMVIKAIAVKSGYKNSPVATFEIKMEAIYAITLLSEGAVYRTVQIRETETVTGLPVPVRNGYHFTGWYLNGARYHEGEKLNGDITLTAGWEKNGRLPSPTCSVASGSVVERGTAVTLSSSMAEAKIYYTLDGTEPTVESRLYRQPLVVRSSMVIRAIAVKSGYENSPVAAFDIKIGTIYTITFINDGTKYRSMQVEETETVTNLPVLVRAGYNFTGWYKDGVRYSEGGKLTEDITLTAGWTLAPPTCNVQSGSTVPKGTQITLTSAASGAKIYYTMDNTMPTTASSLYSRPIILGEKGLRLKAIAVRDGYKNSTAASFVIYAEATTEEEDKPWPFVDVTVSSGNWKYDSVKYVYENEIMTGIKKTDGTINTFEPDSPLTRGMFATVLYRMAGEPAVTWEARFTDVPKGKYYSNAVIWAYRKGIVNGYADKSFGVNDYITREQIAKMLMEYARVQGYTISDRANLSTFPDQNKVSGWATNYVSWAVGVGMISGKNIGGTYYLDPQGRATRAECAAMLMRFLQKYK